MFFFSVIFMLPLSGVNNVAIHYPGQAFYGPTAWSSLLSVRADSPSVNTFRRKLKALSFLDSVGDEHHTSPPWR